MLRFLSVIKMNEKFLTKKRMYILIGLVAFLFFFIIATNIMHPNRYIKCNTNTLNVYNTYLKNGEAVVKKSQIPRGYKVRIIKKEERSSVILYKNNKYTVKNSNLAKHFENAVHTDYVYCRRLVNLRNEKNGKLSKKVVRKGEKIKVVSIDKKDWDENTGQIRWYEVTKGKKTYYISGQYVESTKKMALKNYAKNISYSTYWDAYYKDGYSKKAYIQQIDYKPAKKSVYSNNKMPKHVKAIHVSMENFIHNQKYIESLKGINAIVVEVKNDEGSLLYKSDVCKEYLSHANLATEHAVTSKENLEKIINQYEQKGFYCISRIVTFKDAIFASDNPKESLTDKKGNLVVYNNQYWPSAYSRKAWMYNVDIAKECADLGFKEIQFDYVRFPDGTASANTNLNFHNLYQESKVSAIQGFLQYAKEELSPKNVYVAADIFAWPIVACDDQDIGQFLPAISNVVDIVCPMPYLDHFSNYTFGIENPVDEPYNTLSAFTKLSKEQLKSIQDPSKYRTWIQGYDLSAEQLGQEIKSLKDNHYPDYMIWLASGDKQDIDKIKMGFQ